MMPAKRAIVQTGPAYLTPKSSSGPPGLWLAVRMKPPRALRRRISAETAGVESRPDAPIRHNRGRKQANQHEASSNVM